MGKLRQKQDKKKISRQDIEGKYKRGSGCEQYPAFSFRYLTSNNTYNFDYFLDQKEKDKMFGSLVDRMREISEKPYTHWNGLPKQQGSELIPYSIIKIKPKGLSVAQDDKIIVFRFGSQKYRVLGIRLDGCPIFYIIGFDFDFSAYNHGN